VKEATDNPSSNRLQSGISETQLAEATSRSGYPLQLRVAQELAPFFSVAEEWGYIDRDTKEPRSLDIFAYRSLMIDPQSAFHAELVALIECKRSDLPFVFFESAIQDVPSDYPAIVGFRRRRMELHKPGSGYREVTPSELLCFRDFPFVQKGPPLSRTLVKAERSGQNVDLSDVRASKSGNAVNMSGEVPYRTVILPLASAFHHWIGMKTADNERPRYFPSLTMMICVVDAPMVLVRGRSDKPELQMQPWVRVYRQEPFQDHTRVAYHHYVVDCVHVDYLKLFVDNHLLPFAQSVARRIEDAKSFLAAGKGTVPDWENWHWEDLKAVPGHS
jgi:hypothetical protein